MHLSSTKDKIIYHSIILFGTYGYQNVSMRQIAADIGIKASSIYNHFASKDDILDAVIDKYWQIFSTYHPSFEKLKRLSHTLTAREILEKFCFIYGPDDIVIMLYLLRIQFAEQFRNEKIRDLVFDTFLDNRMKEMKELLELLMQLGKIAPGNPAALAQIWTSTLGISAMRAAHGVDNPQNDLGEFSDFTSYLIDFICGEKGSTGKENETAE